MFYQFHHFGSPDYLKIEKNNNFSFPLHLHQCFEIVILLSGEMEITVDNKSFLLSAGEALLIFPNQIHSLKSTESEHVLCIFSPHLVQAYTTRTTDKIPCSNKFVPHTYLINALETLDPDASVAEKKGVLYSLCALFDKAAAYETKPSASSTLLYRVFSFVEDNFSADCSLSRLSQDSGYDYAYLSRFFRKTVGISFSAYVNHYRLSHACYLMENTKLPVIQCAYESGYSSLRSFNRNFKQYFDMTPSEYRWKNSGKD